MVKFLFLALAFLLACGSLHAARDFDGVDDILDCGAGASLENLKAGGGMTISAWILPDNMGEGNEGVLLGKINTTGWNLRFINGTTNALRFAHAGGALLQRTMANSLLTLDVWSHILLTWDGSNTAANVHIYLNGSEVTYQTTINGATLSTDADQPLFIGAQPGGVRDWNGSIAEVGIWNVILSAGEITSLAKGASSATVRTAAQRPFYAPIWGVASTEPDLSGNKNNCAVTGAVLSNHSPTGPRE